MKGAPRFTLDPPDARTGPTAGADRPAAGAGGVVQRAAGAVGVVPHRSWMSCTSNLGTYIQWWMADTADADASDMAKECEV